MGVSPSKARAVESIENDYELVIRCCKVLDVALAALATRPAALEHGHAGLHELISAAALPRDLEKRVRYLATVRNALVHDHAVGALDDRRGFVDAFVRARAGLDAERAARGGVALRAAEEPEARRGGCAVM